VNSCLLPSYQGRFNSVDWKSMRNTDSSENNNGQILFTSLTHLSRNSSDVFSQTVYGKRTFYVTRYGRVVAEIKPKTEEEQEAKGLAAK
jgi:hypothetical protein